MKDMEINDHKVTLSMLAEYRDWLIEAEGLVTQTQVQASVRAAIKEERERVISIGVETGSIIEQAQQTLLDNGMPVILRSYTTMADSPPIDWVIVFPLTMPEDSNVD